MPARGITDGNCTTLTLLTGKKMFGKKFAAAILRAPAFRANR
jgi:hypothetical protein